MIFNHSEFIIGPLKSCGYIGSGVQNKYYFKFPKSTIEVCTKHYICNISVYFGIHLSLFHDLNFKHKLYLYPHLEEEAFHDHFINKSYNNDYTQTLSICQFT